MMAPFSTSNLRHAEPGLPERMKEPYIHPNCVAIRLSSSRSAPSWPGHRRKTSSVKFRKTIVLSPTQGNLCRTIGRDLGDQDPVPPLFFCPEKSSIRCCQEFHSSGSVVR